MRYFSPFRSPVRRPYRDPTDTIRAIGIAGTIIRIVARPLLGLLTFAAILAATAFLIYLVRGFATDDWSFNF